MTDQIGLCRAEDGQPGPAWIALRQDGRCDLGFERPGGILVFQASMGTLMDIGLGAGAMLAGESGTCSVTSRGHRLAFKVSSDSEAWQEWLVPTATFASAVAKLMATKVELELLVKPEELGERI